MQDDNFNLFDKKPPCVKYSDTSNESASSLKPVIKRLTKQVYDFVKDSDGATCDEVERWLNMKHQTASSRLWDLERKGFIKKTNERRINRSGRKAVVYRIID